MSSTSNPAWLDTNPAQWMRKQDMPGAVGPKCGFEATTHHNDDFSYAKCRHHICGPNEDCLAIGDVYNTTGGFAVSVHSTPEPECESTLCSTLLTVDIYATNNPSGFKFTAPEGYMCPSTVNVIGKTFQLDSNASGSCVYAHMGGVGPSAADWTPL